MSECLNDGWDFISAARCYEIFDREITPRCPGFSRVRDGVLIKSVTSEISHVVQFMRYKGGVYGFRWGTQLTYVPSRWKNRLSWHRSRTSLPFDLWEQACEDMDDPTVVPRDPQAVFANFMHGEERFTRDLRRAWTILGPYVFDWLNQLTELQGVLKTSKRQADRHWHGPQHLPPPALVHAFTLARMGNLEAATEELRAVTAQDDLDPHGNLLRALKKVAAPAK